MRGLFIVAALYSHASESQTVSLPLRYPLDRFGMLKAGDSLYGPGSNFSHRRTI